MADTESEATRRALLALREAARRRRAGRGRMGDEAARSAGRDYATGAMDAAFGRREDDEEERRRRGRMAAKDAVDRIFGARKGGTVY